LTYDDVHEALPEDGIGATRWIRPRALDEQEIEVVDDVAQLKLSPLRADDEEMAASSKLSAAKDDEEQSLTGTTSVPPQGRDATTYKSNDPVRMYLRRWGVGAAHPPRRGRDRQAIEKGKRRFVPRS